MLTLARRLAPSPGLWSVVALPIGGRRACGVLAQSSLFALAGHDIDEIGTHLEANWGEAVVNNWKLWLPASFVTFRYVPPR